MQINDVQIRRQRILDLEGDASEESFAYLCSALEHDPSSIIRHEAAFLLATTRNEEAVDVLIRAILRDKSELVRHESIEALGDLGYKSEKVISLLRTLCVDSDPLIKDTAIVALKTLEMH